MLTDNELVKKIKEENCSDSINQLSRRHEGLIVSMSKRYASQISCSGLGLDDLLADKNYLVYKAASQYDESKGAKFVTWLGTVVRFHCLNTQKKEFKYYNSSEETINFLVDQNPVVPESQDKIATDSDFILNIANQIKNPKLKRIIELRYYSSDKKERSFSAIARKLKMSTYSVITLHNSFIKLAKNKLGATYKMDII